MCLSQQIHVPQQILLFTFVYTTPLFHMPYASLGRLIGTRMSASPEDGFFLFGTFSVIGMRASKHEGAVSNQNDIRRRRVQWGCSEIVGATYCPL